MKVNFKGRLLISLFFIFLISGCATKTLYQTTDLPIPQKTEPHKPENFTAAKKEAWKIHKNHLVSFYCNCAFTPQGEVLANTCDYVPTKVTSRTYKIEWEHIVPAKIFGGDLTCWKKNICTKKDGTHYKGRACCSKVNKKFQQMEANLHNLVPAIGTINQARGTLPFGELDETTEKFMGCPIKIDTSKNKVEPRREIKGLIGRAYLYMIKKYDLALSPEDQALYQKWHSQYPPDKWEIEWNELVKEIQGDENPYIQPIKR